MAFQTITNEEIQQGAPIDNTLLSKIKNNDDTFNTQITAHDSQILALQQSGGGGGSGGTIKALSLINNEVKDVASIGSGFVDLAFNLMSGDSSFITYTLGQTSFTLAPGTYLMSTEGYALGTGTVRHVLRNSDGATVDLTVNAYATTGDAIKFGGNFSPITLTAPKTYRIGQFATVTAAKGFGNIAWAGRTARLDILKIA